MKNGIRHIPFLALVLTGLCALYSCEMTMESLSVPSQDGPVRVAFGVSSAGGPGITKTSVDSYGTSVFWDASDKVRLWAMAGDGTSAIDGMDFSMYGFCGNTAVFTATLPQAMAEGEYQYYACYPQPVSLNGMNAVFNLPAKQDGKASGGADIMVCGPVSGPRLEPVKSENGTRVEDYSGLRLPLRHLVHLLKFFLPESVTGFNGEAVRKIEVTMPGNVVGTVTADISDPSDGGSLSGGSAGIVLELSEPILPSPSEGDRDYACAAIFPASFGDGAAMSLKLYSDNWIGVARDIPLSGKDFLAGHSTPVSVAISQYIPYYHITLRLQGNNLGEPARKISLSVPEGLHLGDGGSDTFVFDPGRDIVIGEEIELTYYDKGDFDALSGHTLAITYESAHAITHQSIALGDLSSVYSAEYAMTVPYLLYEDFSSVTGFSSNDEYKTSSNGDKDAVSFLNGWTGGRVGASAGRCIRIAGRRESGMWIDAHYPARVDSAPIAEITSPVDIEVTFDYGTGNENLNGDVGQHIYLGYVTSTTAYSSGKTTGTFEDDNTIFTENKDGSWTSTPNTVSMTIHGMPAGTSNRITWRNDPERRSDFASNTTSWCYIDNIKVKIKNN